LGKGPAICLALSPTALLPCPAHGISAKKRGIRDLALFVVMASS
jgi:hypothetical protein